MAMGEEGTTEAAVRSSSPTPTSMDRMRGMQGIPNHLYPLHLELTLHMLPGTPSMAICLLRVRRRRNTQVSCNRLDNLGMTSLLALRIRRLMQERHPTMHTCSMPINSGWQVRPGSPSLEMGLTVIGTADLAMVTIPATGQEEVHRALQEDPSMVPLCPGPTMQL